MTEIQKKLLEKKRIDLMGEVNEEMLKYLREAVQILTIEGNPPLTVLITSGGGNASMGLDLYDLIKFYPGKKIGLVHGIAASMAAIILQACDWRVITPNGRILIHHIKCHNFPLTALKNADELDKFLKSRAHLFNQYEILTKKTGKEVGEILARCEEDEYMPAQEAVQYGLVDQIVETEAEIRTPWQTTTS